MESHNTYNLDKNSNKSNGFTPALSLVQGFTLIEVMIVIALIIIIASIGFFFSLDSYRSYYFHSDRDILVSALQRARAEAVGNTCGGPSCTDGKPHGVAIRPADHPNSYVLFQTENTASPRYASRTAEDKNMDILLDANPNVAIGGVTEIVFTQLSANANPYGSISLTDSTGRTSTISVNNAGQIIWTN